jgi:hypothetical protein
MRYVPNLLLVLSLPAGIIGYAIGVRVLSALPLPDGVQGFVVLFVPLLLAGLCMLPFLVPFFDRRAKADLAKYRRSQEASASRGGDEPGEQG